MHGVQSLLIYHGQHLHAKQTRAACLAETCPASTNVHEQPLVCQHRMANCAGCTWHDMLHHLCHAGHALIVSCVLVNLQAANLGGVAVGGPARGGQAVQRGQTGVGGGRQDMGGGS